jgi:hypothetical protein
VTKTIAPVEQSREEQHLALARQFDRLREEHERRSVQLTNELDAFQTEAQEHIAKAQAVAAKADAKRAELAQLSHAYDRQAAQLESDLRQMSSPLIQEAAAEIDAEYRVLEGRLRCTPHSSPSYPGYVAQMAALREQVLALSRLALKAMSEDVLARWIASIRAERPAE